MLRSMLEALAVGVGAGLGDMLRDRLYMRFAMYLGITLLSGVCATGFGSWLA